jgi:hypothetical protein
MKLWEGCGNAAGKQRKGPLFAAAVLRFCNLSSALNARHGDAKPFLQPNNLCRSSARVGSALELLTHELIVSSSQSNPRICD